MQEMRFDRRMSDAEGLMWRLEKDPHLSSTFATVTILDRSPDFDRLRRRMDRAAIAVPRLRQRVQPAPANITAPLWVDDPGFDLDLHLRRVALPRPGSLRQVLDYATLLVADPFDRTRPLWQFVVVDGLRGGKAALIEKMHHTITDGERGVELSLQFLDFDRDAPEPEPLEPEPAEPPSGSASSSSADSMRELLIGTLRLPIGVIRQVKELLADPAQLPQAGGAAAATLRGIVSQLSDTESARSPLWTERSLRRRVEVARAPFRETKDAAKRLGGTLNTAFLTAAAHAASRYHEKLGSPVESLRASMAVSTRTDGSGANAFSLVRMLVPTSPMPIGERFAAIQEATSVAREQSAAAGLDTVAAIASTLPTSVVTRLARQQAQTVDFATSNVKGSPVPMYCAGAQLLENYPIGPLAGVAFNLTLLSYLGSLDMGINTDAAAVTEPELLRRCLDGAFSELVSV
jgi:diacylglycerol O-acyltransferase / wax synthase